MQQLKERFVFISILFISYFWLPCPGLLVEKVGTPPAFANQLFSKSDLELCKRIKREVTDKGINIYIDNTGYPAIVTLEGLRFRILLSYCTWSPEERELRRHKN